MTAVGKFTSLVIGLFIFLLVGSLSSSFAQDIYEVDDTYEQANVLVVSADRDEAYPQSHTIHQADDEDWVKFYAVGGETYSIEVYNLIQFDPYIELFDTDGQRSIKFKNTGGVPGQDETLDWTCPEGEDGIYYARVGQMYSQTYNSGASYDVVLYQPVLFSLPGYLTGKVINNFNQPVPGASIVLSGSKGRGSAISIGNGSFVASAMSGSYTVSVSAPGHSGWSKGGVGVPGSITVVLNRPNQPPVALPDEFQVQRGESVTGNVLLNDTDGDGDTLTAVLDSDVSHGTLQLSSDGSFTYTHDGSSSEDSFTYHANDSAANSEIVQVTLSFSSSHLNLTFLMLLLTK